MPKVSNHKPPFLWLRKLLRKQRLDQGLSQAELGRRLEVQRDLPGQWESGTRTPTLSHLEAWTRALGIRLSIR